MNGICEEGGTAAGGDRGVRERPLALVKNLCANYRSSQSGAQAEEHSDGHNQPKNIWGKTKQVPDDTDSRAPLFFTYLCLGTRAACPSLPRE